MMPRKRSQTLDLLIYLLIRSVVCVLQALPSRIAFGCAGSLAWLAYRVDRRHRKVAAENLRNAFPELSETLIDQRVRNVYLHFCTMLVEMLLIPRKYHQGNILRYVRCEPPEMLNEVLGYYQQDRALICVTGHLGNWEAFSYACGIIGLQASVIARRLDNPYLNAFLNRHRVRTGQEILDKNLDYDKILQVLAGNGALGIMGDQDAGQRGIFVPFFGRPASTYKSIALLALEYNALILVVGTLRTDRPLYFQVFLEDVIRPEDYQHDPRAVVKITERYNRALERLVRRAPDQYFWLHRRWKHQPKAKSREQQKAA